MSLTQHRVIAVTPVYEDVEASSLLIKELAVQFNHDLFIVRCG